MKKGAIMLIAVCLVAASCAGRSPKVAADDATTAGPDIRGTWQVIEAEGKTIPVEKYSLLKMYTAKHFTWILSDKAGNIIGCGGGTYTLDGNTLKETIERTIGMKKEEIPPVQTSELFEEAGRLRVDTDNNTNDEIWERLD